jgi:ubiquinone/menaquinone biosynthesis C-methylase UbiE
MQAKDTIRQYWDYRSTTYTNGNIDIDPADREEWKKWLRSCTGEASGKKVLDVGTGPGFLALLFAEMGHEVHAVDLSDKMVEKARDNAARQGLRIDVRQGDAEALPFDDGTFDVVASKYLLWTLPHPEKALAEWKRVLKDGGIILAIDGEWNRRRWSDRLGERLSRLNEAGYHEIYRRLYAPIRRELPLYTLTPGDLTGLFQGCGLDGVSIRSMASVYEKEQRKQPLLERLMPQKPVYSITGTKNV